MSSNSASCEGAMAEKEENMRRGPWTVEEDMGLIRCVSVQGEGRWNTIAKLAGLKRTGKSCRLRWLNYLRPDVKRGNITPEEQLLILNLHRRWGNRWSKIAQQLPGRTDNEIKNYWRTRIKKQLQKLECAGVNSSKLFEDSARNSWIPTLYHSYVDCTANQPPRQHPLPALSHFKVSEISTKPIGDENLHDGSAFHDQTYFNHGDQLSNAVGLGDEYCMDVSPSSNLEVNTHALASSQLPNNISSSSDTDISQSQQGNEADEALALAGAPSTFANSSEIKPSSYNYAISDVEIMWPFEFDQYSLWNMEEIHQHAYNA